MHQQNILLLVRFRNSKSTPAPSASAAGASSELRAVLLSKQNPDNVVAPVVRRRGRQVRFVLRGQRRAPKGFRGNSGRSAANGPVRNRLLRSETVRHKESPRCLHQSGLLHGLDTKYYERVTTKKDQGAKFLFEKISWQD